MFAAHNGRLGLVDHHCDRRVIVVFARWVASRGSQALCALRGHVMVRHYEPARLSLRCLACGAVTPGWTIDVDPRFRRRNPSRAQVVRLAADRPRRARGTESDSPRTLAA